MRTVIVGAGPTGLFTAIALARRGRDVVVVDRDPGPPPHGMWRRKGVMQFHHAHTFRGPVVEALDAEMPDVLKELTTAGAVVASLPDGRPAALLCRRSTFDRVLRAKAIAEPGVVLITGHVDEVISDRHRAVGVKVHGRWLAADLVIDAAGRASRFTAGIRRPAEGGDCGAVYVTRQYRLRHDATPGPVNSPIGLSLSLAGYWAIAFLHDDRTFSITLTHGGTDKRLRLLRYDEVFDAAVRAIPQLAGWIEPTRARPITPVLPGGRLYNSYRGQADDTGLPALPGLISVGDAVCTTTPLAGRGVTLALRQAREMVRILDTERDIETATMQFDSWCAEQIRPWFDDHRYADAARMRRWAGEDVDVSLRLPSDLIVAAAQADPALRSVVEPYARMDALPASLDAAEPRARALFARGWRPSVAAGPTIDELSAAVSTRPEAA
ncbi:FAD-dependent oxidoreductase [Mycobacterium hubeiense]|uniref:FAD-dependent oxidoreductase n=1 Tax=Mycobacterium hubeiense TaxID=1867256 RepID=UPI000C7F0833|nr:FAD-dependent oxidoreductase [Mycobacterium sp. QGD 101]